jgi:hypothetical protein
MAFKINEKDVFPRSISDRPGFDLCQVKPSFRKVLKDLIECSRGMGDGEKNIKRAMDFKSPMALFLRRFVRIYAHGCMALK